MGKSLDETGPVLPCPAVIFMRGRCNPIRFDTRCLCKQGKLFVEGAIGRIMPIGMDCFKDQPPFRDCQARRRSGTIPAGHVRFPLEILGDDATGNGEPRKIVLDITLASSAASDALMSRQERAAATVKRALFSSLTGFSTPLAALAGGEPDVSPRNEGRRAACGKPATARTPVSRSTPPATGEVP